MNDSSTTPESLEKPNAEQRAFEAWDERLGPRKYVRGAWQEEWARIQREGK